MSLSESDKSAASCARRDNVLTRNGPSTFRCFWTFSRSSGGVANKSSEGVTTLVWGSQVLPMRLSPSSAIQLSGTVS